VEQIKSILETADTSLSFSELLYHTDDSATNLWQKLNKLSNEAIVYVTSDGKYMLYSKTKYLIGRVISRNGSLYFKEQSTSKQYLIDEKILQKTSDIILKNDIVAYQPDKSLKLVKRAPIIGQNIGTNLFVVSDSIVGDICITVPESETSYIKGDYAFLELSGQIGKKESRLFDGKVTSLICNEKDVDARTKLILASYGFPIQFSAAVSKAASLLPTFVSERDKEGRVDLTRLPFIAIDSKTTMDRDDAVYLEKQVIDGNVFYDLYVSIADVSHYVDLYPEILEAARERTTSVYPPDHTVSPMLPKELSDGICSLNEGVERLAVTTQIRIDINGNIIDYKIYPSVIKSVKNCNYDACNQILMNNYIPQGYEGLALMLLEMNELSKILIKKRRRNGSSAYESLERVFDFDKNKRVISYEYKERYDAEKLIESFMIQANICAAKFVKAKGVVAPFRDHEEPDSNKINELLDYVNDVYGIEITKAGSYSDPKSLQEIDRELRKYPNIYKHLSRLLLRCTQRAEYSTQGIGHYALATKNYAHSTSPIRRDSDLELQRIIKKILAGKYATEEDLQQLCSYCSLMERQAEKVEKYLEKMLIAEVMSERIGCELEGKITKITDNGYYVVFDNGTEGFVESDNYSYAQYNSFLYCLIVNDNEILAPGCTVKVRVDSVDLGAGTIKLKEVSAEPIQADVRKILDTIEKRRCKVKKEKRKRS